MATLTGETSGIKLGFDRHSSLLQKYEHCKLHKPHIVEHGDCRYEEKEYYFQDIPQDVATQIQAIHKQVEEEAKELKRKEAIQQNLPSNINMHFSYYFPDQKSKIDGIDEDNITLFDKKGDAGLFEKIFTDEDEPDCSQARLEIIVEDAYNLDKWNKPNEKLIEAAVKVEFLPDSTKRGPKLKTDYKRVSFDYARWDHKFIFQGFNIEELIEKTLVFELRAKTNKGKKKIGSIKLNTTACEIGELTQEEEQYCTSDIHIWEKFLETPTVSREVFIPVRKAK